MDSSDADRIANLGVGRDTPFARDILALLAEVRAEEQAIAAAACRSVHAACGVPEYKDRGKRPKSAFYLDSRKLAMQFVAWECEQRILARGGKVKRRVVAAALRKDGVIYSLPPPARHDTVILMMFDAHGVKAMDADQGFVLDDGTFLDRAEAEKVAIEAGQIKRKATGGLFSEDLW